MFRTQRNLGDDSWRHCSGGQLVWRTASVTDIILLIMWWNVAWCCSTSGLQRSVLSQRFRTLAQVALCPVELMCHSGLKIVASCGGLDQFWWYLRATGSSVVLPANESVSWRKHARNSSFVLCYLFQTCFLLIKQTFKKKKKRFLFHMLNTRNQVGVLTSFFLKSNCAALRKMISRKRSCERMREVAWERIRSLLKETYDSSEWDHC